MTPLERAGYLAHARSARFQRLLAATRDCLHFCLFQAPTSYLSWSGGKDSSALLWLLAEIHPHLPVRCLTSGETRLLHRNFDAVWGWWREHWPQLALTEILMDRVFSEGWQEADWTTQRKAGKHDMRDQLTDRDAGGVFLGLRGEESHARRSRFTVG